jgi:HK97 family phage portal protein
MSWIQDIFRGQQAREQAQQTQGKSVPGVPSSTAETGGKQSDKQTVGGGSFAEHIIPARDPQTALTVSAVYRAVELRAKTIGQMLIQYQVKDRVGGNFTQSKGDTGNRLNYLLQVEPNPIMSAASLWEQVTIDRLQKGNGFIYIERDPEDDMPVALWLATCGGYNLELGTYNIVYLSDRGLIAKANVPRKDVLHFPNTYRFQNGFWGVSTLQYAFETLSLIKTQKAQALETAAKGGRVKGFISEDKQPGQLGLGMYNKNTSNEYAKEISDKIYQQDIVSLRGLEKFQSISMTSAEMQMVEQLNLGMDDVSRFFATPRPLLMLDTNSHYNDYKNATMEYLQRTIAPDAREIEDELNRKLLTVYDFGKLRFHLCELPLLRMDLESQAKVDQLHLQMGWTVNEIRGQYDMPAVKDGDTPFRTANVKPLNGAEDGSTELKPGTYTVPAQEPKGKEGEEGKVSQ